LILISDKLYAQPQIESSRGSKFFCDWPCLFVAIPFHGMKRHVLGTQAKPHIEVSTTRVKSGGLVYVTGTGFTPNGTAMSHLIRPDGSEYNPLRLRTNERGEFFHRIDTTMLDQGTFGLWAEDEAAKVVSNRAQFTVE
jgi:hypothetical protein